MPAPSQWSEERAERILGALKLGASREGAASCAGIAASTLYDWIRRGKVGEAPYDELWRRIEIDSRAWEVRALEVVQGAARNGRWQAAAWILERRLPKRYGKRATMDDARVNELVEERLREMIADAQSNLAEEKAHFDLGTTPGSTFPALTGLAGEPKVTDQVTDP